MKQRLINTLETICPNNVYQQGTLAADAPYPSSFITIWTDDTLDHAHYDNDVDSIDWYFTVIFYSDDPALLSTIPLQIRAALKAVGFIPDGIGMDIPSDRPTHTGWAMEFKINQKLKEN